MESKPDWNQNRTDIPFIGFKKFLLWRNFVKSQVSLLDKKPTQVFQSGFDDSPVLMTPAGLVMTYNTRIIHSISEVLGAKMCGVVYCSWVKDV